MVGRFSVRDCLAGHWGGASVSDDFTVYVKDGSTGTASAAVDFAIPAPTTTRQ